MLGMVLLGVPISAQISDPMMLGGLIALLATTVLGMVLLGVPISAQISDPMMLGGLIALLATSVSVLLIAWRGFWHQRFLPRLRGTRPGPGSGVLLTSPIKRSTSRVSFPAKRARALSEESSQG